MNISVIGTGYVGLVAAACLAKLGHRVKALDIDPAKLEVLRRGKCWFYEPGLQEIMESQLQAGRLSFTGDPAAAVAHGRVIFVAVGTPPKRNGQADTSGIERAFEEIALRADSAKIAVIKSTVPVGTAMKMRQKIQRMTSIRIDVVSNPEFLREGSAVDDFLRPDRVVIGCQDRHAGQVVKGLYEAFVPQDRVLMMTNPAAELVKYAANAFLATRISFINEIAEFCAASKVDIQDVVRGISTDRRIGGEFFKAGIDYGGSCFPKDIRSLIYMSRQAGLKAEILRSVHRRNQHQKKLLGQMILQRFGHDLRGRRLAVWGLAFKPSTDDVREAPALQTIRMLADAGAQLVCYDPAAEQNARRVLANWPNVSFGDDQYEVLDQADCLVICTDWRQFAEADFSRILTGLRQRVIFDGRNMYDPARIAGMGIEYHSIGRSTSAPAAKGQAVLETT